MRGCISLFNARPVSASISHDSDNPPVLVLLKELHSRGFERCQNMVTHEADLLLYDHRNVGSKRKYLQCLLILETIIDRVTRFRSNQCQNYYELLLKGQSPREGLPATEYKKLLLVLSRPELRGNDDMLDILAPGRKRQRVDVVEPVVEVDGDDGTARPPSGSDAGSDGGHPRSPDSSTDSSSSSSSADSTSSSSSSQAPRKQKTHSHLYISMYPYADTLTHSYL